MELPQGQPQTATAQFQLTDWLTAKLLLALRSTEILGSESQGTHDHILFSEIWKPSRLHRRFSIYW
jgi:hypothetical protein